MLVALLLAFLIADPASAQIVCNRSYTVSQTGGRQLIVDGTRINSGNPCGFTGSPPTGAPQGSQLRINGVLTAGGRTLRYANGATVEVDASGKLWFTPGETYSASMVIFADPSGAGAITATDTSTGTSAVVMLLASNATSVNGSRFRVTLSVTAPAVSAPTVSGTLSAGSLYLGQSAVLTQTFTNPNGFAVVLSNSTAAPAGVAFIGSPGGSCDGATLTAGSVSVQGATLAANASCTVTASVTASTSGTKTLTPGAPTATAFGTSIAGTAGNALMLDVRQLLAPTASLALPATRIGADATTRVTVTLVNPNGDAALVGVGASVTLPGGVTLAPSPAVSNDCGGSIDSAGSLTGGALGAGASCSFGFLIRGDPGSYEIAPGAPSASDAAAGAPGAATALLVLQRPAIIGITPAFGTIAGGTAVTIDGSGFDDVLAVHFGAAAASFTRPSATRLVATSPAVQADALVSIAVTTDGGTSVDTAADDFRYRAPPSAPQIVTPAAGAVLAPGTVEVRGTADAGASVVLQVDGVDAGTVDADGAGTWRFSVVRGAGTYRLQAQATRDGIGGEPSANTSFTIAAPLSVARSGDVTGAVGTAITAAPLVASGGVSPYRFTSEPLPAGLTLDAATGAIAGTPTAARAAAALTMTVTDQLGQTASASFDLTIAKGVQTVAFTTAAPTAARIGNLPISVAAAASSGLVARLSVDPASAGICSLGTRTISLLRIGTCRIVADQPGDDNWQPAAAVTLSFMIAPAPLSVYAAPAAGNVVGGAFTQANTAGGGIAPYRYAVASGALPAGIALDPDTGLASGTLAAAGSYTYAVGATDAAGTIATSPAVTGTIAPPPLIVTAAPASGVVGSAFVQTNTVSGGTAPYVFALQSGELPPGLALQSGGNVTGIPTRAGSYSYRVQATDRDGAVAAASVTVTVAKGQQTISFAALPSNPQIGDTPQVLAVSATSGLAVELTIDPASTAICALAGNTIRFLAPGTCSISADQPGNDDWHPAAPVQQSFVIRPPPLTLAAGALAGRVGTAILQQPIASGGVLPYRFTVASGALPAGATLDPQTGVVGGVAEMAGAVAFTLRVTDADGTTADQAVAGSIGKGVQTIRFTAAPPVTVIVGGSYAPAASASSGLPIELQVVSENCRIEAGEVRFITPGSCIVEASQPGDANWQAAAPVQQSFAIAPPTLTIAPGDTEAGTVGIAFAQSHAIAGGVPPYTVSLASGSLPTGLSLDGATGTVHGTPTAAGSFVYRLQATDAAGATSTGAAITLMVAKGTQTVAFSTTAPNPHLGDMAYAPAAAASSGLTALLSIDPQSATNCRLDNGAVQFLSAGECIVRADQAGGDNWQAAASVQQRFTIRPAALVLTATPPETARVGVPFLQQSSASGGTAPYRYSASAGALPTGVTLGVATGAARGTPEIAGAFAFTITVTDADGNTASQLVSGTVAKGLQTLRFADATGAFVVGGSYRPSATSTANLAASFRILTTGTCVVEGELVRFLAVGSCIVEAQQPGDTNWEASPSVTQQVTVAPPPLVIATPSATTGSVGIAFAQTNIIAGGTPPYGATVASGSLPPGTTLAADGAIGGKPTRAGSFAYRLLVTDAAGATLTSATIDVTIVKGMQTIAFDAAPAAPRVGDPTFTLRAIATSGLAATIEVEEVSAGICAIAGTSVTFVATGSCTLRAEQPGNADWEAAPAARQSFTIAPATLQLAGAAPSARVGVAFDQQNSATGGVRPYRFVLAQGALPSGTTLDSMTGLVAGTPGVAGAYGYTIRVTDAQGATATHSLAGTVERGEQAIRFATTPPAEPIVGGSYAPLVTAESGLAIRLTITGQGVCEDDGGRVRFIGAGMCVIRAEQGGNANWAPAPPVEQRIAVAPPQLTITHGAAEPAQVGVALGRASALAGGVPPYAVTLASGALPQGLALDRDTGLVHGTPGRAGTYSYRLQVSDGAGATATTPPVTMTVGKGAQTIAFAAAAPAPRLGETVDLPRATASSGLTVSVSVDPASAGICTASGIALTFQATGTCTLRAQQAGDDDWQAAPVVLQSFAVAPARLVLTVSQADGRVGVTFARQAGASGGVAPYGFAVASGAVPAGTTLDPDTGTVAGMPRAAGSFAYTLRVTDATGASAEASVAGTIARGAQVISFTSVGPAAGMLGGSYLPEVTASSALPVRITASGACVAEAGGVRFVTTGICTIEAQQSGDADWEPAVPVQQRITVAPPALVLTADGVRSGTVGTGFVQQNGITGGVQPYSVSLASGSLPAGVTLDSATGRVGGTLTKAGAFTYRLQAADAAGQSVLGEPVTITVAKGPQSIAMETAAPTPRLGDGAYLVRATASSGLPVRFAVDPASAGVCGVIGDSVSFTATGTCIVRAEQPGDADWNAAPVAEQRIVVRAAVLTASIGAATGAKVGSVFAQSLTVTGGVAPYTFSLASGALPTGLMLDAGTGAIDGTPAHAGEARYSLQVRDAAGDTVTIAAAVTIAKGDQTIAFATTPPATAMPGATYVPRATSSAGLAVAYTLGGSGCVLEGGLVRFIEIGSCVLTAEQGGDADWNAAAPVEQRFTIVPEQLMLAIAPAGPASVGAAFRQASVATGGIPPYAFGLDGVLPAGLRLDPADGAISGEPRAAGSFVYRVRVQDTRGTVATSEPVTLNVGRGSQTITFTTAAPGARIGDGAYVVGATASSGLSVHLTIDPASSAVCAITGTTVSYLRSGTCTILASQDGDGDWSPAPATQQSFAVGASTLTIATGSTGASQVATSYQQANVASGGTAPYRFDVISGTLPTGIMLDANTGRVSGTPVHAGAFSYSVRVTDAAGESASGDAVAGTIVRGSQTIGFASPGDRALASGSLSLAATSSAGLPVVVATLSPAICSVEAAVVTLRAAGTCTVVARQSGDGDWEPAEVSHSFVVRSSSVDLLALEADAPLSPAFDPQVGEYQASVAASVSAITLRATAPAGATVAIGAAASGAAIPLVLGRNEIVVTVTAADGETVRRYRIVVTRAKAEQSIRFTTAPPASAIVGGSLPVAAEASSGLPVTLVVAPDSAGICAIDGGQVRLLATGTCVLLAAQAGDDNWAAAALVEQRIAVVPPTLALTAPPPAEAQVGVRYNQAIAAIGGVPPYRYALANGSPPAGTILDTANGTVTGVPTAAGTFEYAVQVTDSAGSTASVSLRGSVAKGTQTIVFAPIADIARDAPAPALVAQGSSGLGVALASLTPDKCALADTLRVVAAGICTIEASQPGNADWDAAAPVQRSFAILAGQPPVAADLRIETPFATATSVDLAASITGGAHGNIAIATPSHGIAALSGTVLRYVPAAGYSGSDAVTYTVAGRDGGSATATVTFVVGTPAAPAARDRSGVVVAFGSGGVAIDLAGSVEGAFTNLALAAQPANGAVTLAGNVVTYVPARGFHGVDSFGFTATGPGGTSAPAMVQLVIGRPAPPTAADRTGVAVVYETATQIDLAPSIEGAVTGSSISAAPSHGTATIAGQVVTYTPTDDYSGPDSFGYVVTGPGGSSRAATVGLVVGAPPPPVAAGGNASVNSATSVAANGVAVIDLSALIAGEFNRIDIVELPANGTVTIGTAARARSTGRGGGGATAAPFVAEYTPRPGFVGTDSFSFAASGIGGTSPPATVTVTVRGSKPSLAPLAAATGDNQTVSIDLTAGASEGPFTGAAITALTPEDAAAASIFSAAAGSYRLDVTPSPRFGGTVTVRYTLDNAYGSSAGSVSVKVTARPDPSADPNVRALSDAQGETVRRFARTQAGNFLRRAEQLHAGGGAAASMGVRVNARDGRAAPRDMSHDDSGLALTRRMRIATEGVEEMPLAAARGGDPLGPRPIGSVAFWSSGAIEIGTMDRTSGRTKITATTSGLSAGADVLLATGLSVGLGGGYGNDVSEIGGGAGQVRGINRLVAGYASLVPVDGAFIDAMAGLGELQFRTRRLTDSGTASGIRAGRFSLGAISAGIERNRAVLQWALYGRAEYLRGTLGGYTESGAGRANLRFDERTLRSLVASLGGRIELRERIGAITVAPRLRAEWSRELAEAEAQALDYADLAADSLYRIDAANWSRSQFNMVVGTRFDLPPGWSFDIEGGLRLSAGERAMLLRLLLTLTF